MTPEQREALHEIYALVPAVKCRGLCTHDCGVIGAHPEEWKTIEMRSGKRPQVREDLSCNYLVNGKCTVYSDRPLICRTYGATEGLMCPYGCEIEGIPLSFRQNLQLADAIQEVLGRNEAMHHWNASEDQVIQDMAERSGKTIEEMRRELEERDLEFGVKSKRRQYESYANRGV